MDCLRIVKNYLDRHGFDAMITYVVTIGYDAVVITDGVNKHHANSDNRSTALRTALCAAIGESR